MRPLTFMVFCLIFCSTLLCLAQSDIKNLRKDILILAADSLKGRLATSLDGQKAADYIVSEFIEADIASYLDVTYFHEFKLDTSKLFDYEKKKLRKMGYKGLARNVIGVVEGYDSLLKSEYILVGAHYDHIGCEMKDGRVVIFNGADDNASGVAMMLEVARHTKAHPVARSVIFVAFDAEELGALGATQIVADALIPLNRIKVMFSLDMVGGLNLGKKLEYCGVNHLNRWRELLVVPSVNNMNIIYEQSNAMFLRTDCLPFVKAGVAGVYVNTGLDTPYHLPEDDAEFIDYDGLVSVTNHFITLLKHLASQSYIN